MSSKKITQKEGPKYTEVVYFDSSVIALNDTISKKSGIDITFQNISYSVEVLD